MIWRHFGRDYLGALHVPATYVEALHAKFDEDFVLPVDLMDNGALEPSAAGALAKLTLPVLLETLRPVFDDRGQDADSRAFHAALSIAQAFVEASIRQGAAKLRAESMVLEAIAAAGDNGVLELPMGMPFRPAIVKAGADHLLFVVHPREAVCGVTGATFCHNGRFIAAAKTRDAALEMARIAAAQAQQADVRETA